MDDSRLGQIKRNSLQTYQASELTITEQRLKFNPHNLTNPITWLRIGYLSTLWRATASEFSTALPFMTEVAITDIQYFQADPGYPSGLPPSIKLSLANEAENKIIQFPVYYCIPPVSYFQVRRALINRGIADESKPVNTLLRAGYWLIIPLFLFLGYQVFHYYKGAVGLFGGILFLWGCMMMLVCLGEILWSATQSIFGKQ
jgi:hypothetical protein